jgi:hypothetical protein
VLDFEDLEREYRGLSAKIVYALLKNEEVSQVDLRRLEELAELRVKCSAPDFSSLVNEAA